MICPTEMRVNEVALLVLFVASDSRGGPIPTSEVCYPDPFNADLCPDGYYCCGFQCCAYSISPWILAGVVGGAAAIVITCCVCFRWRYVKRQRKMQAILSQRPTNPSASTQTSENRD